MTDTEPEPELCSLADCRRPARMAVTTLAPHDGHQVWSKVFYDDRDAPTRAFRYCKQHGYDLVSELAKTLVVDD